MRVFLASSSSLRDWIRIKGVLKTDLIPPMVSKSSGWDSRKIHSLFFSFRDCLIETRSSRLEQGRETILTLIPGGRGTSPEGSPFSQKSTDPSKIDFLAQGHKGSFSSPKRPLLSQKAHSLISSGISFFNLYIIDKKQKIFLQYIKQKTHKPMKNSNLVKISLLVLLCFFASSCSVPRGGSYRRIKGKKVWIPSHQKKLKGRYERCYF